MTYYTNNFYFRQDYNTNTLFSSWWIFSFGKYYWIKFLNIPNEVYSYNSSRGKTCIITYIYILKVFNLALRQKFYLYFNTYILEIQFKENNPSHLVKIWLQKQNVTWFPSSLISASVTQLHCGTVIHFQINIEHALPKLAWSMKYG